MRAILECFHPHPDLIGGSRDVIGCEECHRLRAAIMNLAQSLVRSCVRSFYETKHVLVIDALIIHSAYVSQVTLVSFKADVYKE